VIVWSDDATRVYGSISARGGAESGNGGFVETSGHRLEVTRGPDVAAPRGAAGTWLLDPDDLALIAWKRSRQQQRRAILRSAGGRARASA
jgi:hypothetical protein